MASAPPGAGQASNEPFEISDDDADTIVNLVAEPAQRRPHSVIELSSDDDDAERDASRKRLRPASSDGFASSPTKLETKDSGEDWVFEAVPAKRGEDSNSVASPTPVAPTETLPERSHAATAAHTPTVEPAVEAPQQAPAPVPEPVIQPIPEVVPPVPEPANIPEPAPVPEPAHIPEPAPVAEPAHIPEAAAHVSVEAPALPLAPQEKQRSPSPESEEPAAADEVSPDESAYVAAQEEMSDSPGNTPTPPAVDATPNLPDSPAAPAVVSSEIASSVTAELAAEAPVRSSAAAEEEDAEDDDYRDEDRPANEPVQWVPEMMEEQDEEPAPRRSTRSSRRRRRQADDPETSEEEFFSLPEEEDEDEIMEATTYVSDSSDSDDDEFQVVLDDAYTDEEVEAIQQWVIGQPKISKKTAFVYDERMLQHLHPTEHHPECPDRIRSIHGFMEKCGLLEHYVNTAARDATVEEITRVHTRPHYDYVLSTAAMDTEVLTSEALRWNSIYFNAGSAAASLLSCGGTIEAAAAVMNGSTRNAVAIVRPPGHHAEHDAPMGFCLFNNVAVATRAAKAQMGAQRVMILDWDVHHGNGTQHIFADDPDVLYVSLHRYDNGDFYPKSFDAACTVVGNGAAAGTNVNIPWPHGNIGDADYLYAFRSIIMPIAEEFAPDLVFISAGFDAAKGDPIGGLNVTTTGYAHMTHMLSSLAGGRVVLVLEGGYNLRSISVSATACAAVLMGATPPAMPRGPGAVPCNSAIQTVAKVAAVQSAFWSALRPRHFDPTAYFEAITREEHSESEEEEEEEQGKAASSVDGGANVDSGRMDVEESAPAAKVDAGKEVAGKAKAAPPPPPNALVASLAPLRDVVQTYEQFVLANRFKMKPLVVDAAAVSAAAGVKCDEDAFRRVFCTEDVLWRPRVVLMLHGTGRVRAAMHPLENIVDLDASYLTNTVFPYVVGARRREYAVVSLNCSPMSDNEKEEQDGALLLRALALHVWDTIVCAAKEPKFVGVIASGEGIDVFQTLLSSRDVASKMSASVTFPMSVREAPMAEEKDIEWFADTTAALVPSSEVPAGDAVVVPSNKGRAISAGKTEIMETYWTLHDFVFDFLKVKESRQQK